MIGQIPTDTRRKPQGRLRLENIHLGLNDKAPPYKKAALDNGALHINDIRL
jgi:hypothetical protein